MKGAKRHQMMQNLFGDQSEEEEEEQQQVEEEEVDSEHESNQHRPNYISDDNEAVEQVEQEVEGEPYAEEEGEAEVGYHEGEVEVGESEGEREQSSQEVDVAEHQDESDARETDTDEKDDYSQRVVTSRRRDVVESGSEHSEEQEPRYIDPEDDEEVGQTRSQGGSPEEERNQPLVHSAAEIRDVFGDSDEDEPTEYGAQHDVEQEPKYPLEEEESYEKNLRPEELVRDEDAMYGSEEEIDNKPREKPLGPPMELEIPLRPPPALPDKMNMIRVSNIMGIDPKPFDAKTYVEEDVFVTDESGVKKRIRLENNIVRWRTVKKADGSLAYESNARFVKWSDGSIQLQIGHEVLDISVQDAQHDNAYLFLRHGKGILQSQGKILKKMRFMPSSLSSNSHRLLTALVDSRHKKVYKVKNCITDVDPEKEKEKKERAESQTIRANSTLARKRDKVTRRYTRPSDRGRQLSPGFLEDALEEDDEANYYDSRRSGGSRRHFEDELEAEARAEKRIINAKKGQLKDIPRKSSTGPKTSRRPVDFSDSDKEGSYYETDGEEEEAPERPYEDSEPEWQDSEDDVEPEEQAPQGGASDEEAEEPKHTVKEAGSSLKRKEYESDEESPRKKPTTHRRMAVVYDSDEE